MLQLHIDLHLIFITSFAILGINYATDYDLESPHTFKNVLWFLKLYCTRLIGEYWTRPLFGCVVCMSSFYSILFYFLFSPTITIQDLCVSIVVVAGFNRFLSNFL